MPRVVVHLRRRDLLRAQFQMVRRMAVVQGLLVGGDRRLRRLATGIRTTPPTGSIVRHRGFCVSVCCVTGAAVLLTCMIVAAAMMLMRLREHPRRARRAHLRDHRGWSARESPMSARSGWPGAAPARSFARGHYLFAMIGRAAPSCFRGTRSRIPQLTTSFGMPSNRWPRKRIPER